MNEKKIHFIVFGLSFMFFFNILNAQTWSPFRRLTYSTGASWRPAITTDTGNNIHFVWDDRTPGNYEIFFKRSTNGGANWSSAKRLTYSSGHSQTATIATDIGNNIHVVWHDSTPGNQEIFYKKSTDGGTSWFPVRRLTYNLGQSFDPAIATDTGNNIHVVWGDWTSGDAELYYKKSTDGGAHWSSIRRLTYSSGYSVSHTIATDNENNIHVVWHDNKDGAVDSKEIYYKKSANGGATWSPARRLTYNLGPARDPSIAIDTGNNIHVVWQASTPGYGEIFYKNSTDGGAAWSPLRRLTYGSMGSAAPSIATDTGNNIYIVWFKGYIGTVKNDIYFKKSTDGGSSWSFVRRLTYSSGDSFRPAIATDTGNYIHVVWEDNSPGNVEIFYKKGIK